MEHFKCAAKHFEKSSNMPKIWPKNEEKPCTTCLKSISPWHFQTLKPGFRVPELSLNTYLNEILLKNSVTVRDCINKQQSLETINAFWQSANALYARVGA